MSTEGLDAKKGYTILDEPVKHFTKSPSLRVPKLYLSTSLPPYFNVVMSVKTKLVELTANSMKQH